MKNIYIVLLVFVFCACGKSSIEMDKAGNGKLQVLATTAMIDDLVSKIGGEEVDHESLILGNIDPHSYELVKGDGERISKADVVFFNGLGLEHGASLKNQLDRHPYSFPLGDLIYKQNSEAFLFVNGQIDPHIWMDIALFSQAIDPIVEALSKKAPIYAELFQDRGQQLKKAMHLKDEALYNKIQQVPKNKRFLVTSHDAFHYFVKKYLAEPEEIKWEERLIAPEGLAPDGQMSVLDIQKVTEFLCKHQIHVVFPESNINRDALKKIVAICREKGLHVKISDTPLYGDTMGDKIEGVSSYLEMIEHNILILSRNFN